MTKKTYTATRTLRYAPGGQSVKITGGMSTVRTVEPTAPRALRPVTWGQLVKTTPEGQANRDVCVTCEQFLPLNCGTPQCRQCPGVNGGEFRMVVARGQCPIGKHEGGVDV